MIRVAATADVHVGADSRGRLGPHFEHVAEHADVLLIGGDLTKCGTADEARVLVDELSDVPIPRYAVLGNHDHHADEVEKVVAVLEGGGIHVLEGSHDVPAPRQKVWEAFLDPARLKKAIPGCEKLEAVGPDEYKATMKVGVGGVKGTFEGKVKITEQKPPESYKLAVEGSGGPGFVRGETVITLSDPEGGGTRVAYSADVQVGGLIASVGQRMLGGVSKMMADKFFGKMSELLQDKK